MVKFAGSLSQSTQIKCFVHAKPPAKIYWQRNKINITNNLKFNIFDKGEESSLVIRNIENSDYGDYQCVAFNKLGTVLYNIQLSQPGMHNCF